MIFCVSSTFALHGVEVYTGQYHQRSKFFEHRLLQCLSKHKQCDIFLSLPLFGTTHIRASFRCSCLSYYSILLSSCYCCISFFLHLGDPLIDFLLSCFIICSCCCSPCANDAWPEQKKSTEANHQSQYKLKGCFIEIQRCWLVYTEKWHGERNFDFDPVIFYESHGGQEFGMLAADEFDGRNWMVTLVV